MSLGAVNERAPRGAKLTIVVVFPRELIRVERKIGLRGVSHAEYRPPRCGAVHSGGLGGLVGSGKCAAFRQVFPSAGYFFGGSIYNPSQVYIPTFTHVIIGHIVHLGNPKIDEINTGEITRPERKLLHPA